MVVAVRERALLRRVRRRVRRHVRVPAAADVLEGALHAMVRGRIRSTASMYIDFQCIHSGLVHCVTCPILTVPGDQTARLRLVRIAHIIDFL